MTNDFMTKVAAAGWSLQEHLFKTHGRPYNIEFTALVGDEAEFKARPVTLPRNVLGDMDLGTFLIPLGTL